MHLPTCSSLLLAFSVLFALVHAASFTNPLKNPNGSDPHIVYTGGYYYLTTTTWTNIQITRATTLGGLKTATPTTVWTDSTASRSGNFWAPELHWINNKWWLYYTAGTAACCSDQHQHVLEGGANPLDRYTYRARLDSAWSLDGTILRFGTQLYLVWSRMSPANRQSLYIATMSNPYTIGTPYLLSEPTASWETVGAPVNEGPAALYYGGKTYLTFSASYCVTTSYQLGLLTYKGSGDPLQASSWTKSGPVFSGANGNLGAGHNGFFTSPNGNEVWNVYHATQASGGSCGGNRYTMAQKVNWNSNNTPNFGSPLSLSTVITGPAGE